MIKISIPVVAVFLLVAGCSTSPTRPDLSGYSPIERLRYDLASGFDDPNFFNAHWGVMIQSLKTGEVICQRNENKSFMPASNMKLFTTSAGLTTLTPDFRYTTRLYANGSVKNGVLNGAIVVKGGADPTISGRYNGGKITELFEQWADSLKARNINEVGGDIIGDDNCFDEEDYGDGWAANYETDWYAAQIGGIIFNDNCVDFTVTAADSTGAPAKIEWKPATSYVTVINETMTVPPESTYYISFYRERGKNIIHVKGRFPRNKSPWEESIAIDNPTLYAMSVFKEVLEQKGLKVRGVPKDIDSLNLQPAYDSMTVVATSLSIPLSEIVRTINKPSQNLYAEQLFRTMGMVYHHQGSVRTGRWVANPVFATWGMDTTRLMMIDGSGLSRMNLVSPSNIVSLLKGMYSGPFFTTFYESLPVAGVDGTIRNRMKGTKAEGNVHAKTGYIGYVRSLSGYVTSADGEMFVFSMMANHYTVPTSMVERVQNDVCIQLANFSRK